MSREYFDQQASLWDERAAEKDASKLRALVAQMALDKGARVLDVGTGTGVLLPYLLDAIGPAGKVFALDFAGLMLRQAANKHHGSNVAYLLADAGHIPAASGNFDGVVCYSSFPHFPDKPRAVSEMYRVLRKGGRLLISHTSSREDINARHRKIPAVRNDLLPDEAQMRGILAAAGFTEISIEDRRDGYLASATRSEL